MAQCPVCGIRIPEPITPFCGQCGWDLGNDITLMTSIGPIPERIRDDYQRRVEIARRNWNERLQAIARQKELEKKLAEQEASEKQRALEHAFIKKCRESNDPPGSYREYLRKYPDGFYREEAERAITESERRLKEQEASERQRELERKAAEEEALAQQKRREHERKAAEEEALVRQRQQELDRKAAEQEALAQQRQRELDRRLAEQAESERRRQEALAQRIAEQEARIRLELQAEPEPVSQYVPPTPTPAPPIRRGLPTWGKWVLSLLAILVIAFIASLASVKTFTPPNPWREAWDGAVIWAQHNLPSQQHVTVKMPSPYSDSPNTLMTEIVDCEVVGTHSWVVAYYGCYQRCRPYDYVKDLCCQQFPGTGYIIYSSDQGKTWEIQKQISDWVPVDMESITFLNETEGFATGHRGILHTNDGGKNWNYLELPPEIQFIAFVQSIDGYHLVISCNDDEAKYESFDGGKIWQRKVQ